MNVPRVKLVDCTLQVDISLGFSPKPPDLFLCLQTENLNMLMGAPYIKLRFFFTLSPLNVIALCPILMPDPPKVKPCNLSWGEGESTIS